MAKKKSRSKPSAPKGPSTDVQFAMGLIAGTLERIAEAIERIADAGEKAYPPMREALDRPDNDPSTIP